MKKTFMAALILSASLAIHAGSPRCVGSFDPVNCERFEAELAAETPSQKAARIQRLEKNRQSTSAQIAKQPIRKDSVAIEPVRTGGVSIGMNQNEVIASSWGKPRSVNRTTYSSGTHEQWVYGSGNYLYFTNGILTTIQN